MRTFLDKIYLYSGYLAAICLIFIGLLVLTSIVTRLMGTYISGLSDYARYTLAGLSFLGLAYAFGHGSHIRVNLVLSQLSTGPRRYAEIWCLGVTAFLGIYFAYYSVDMVMVSYELGDISEGPDKLPLWIPQLSMLIGSVVFAICLVDRFILVLLGAPIEEEDSEDMASVE